MRVEFTIIVASSEPVLLFNVKIKNISNSKKDIDAYFLNRPQPDISWHAAYGLAKYHKEINGIIYSHDGFRLPNEYTRIFVSSDKKYDSFETNLTRFKGDYNGLENPIALKDNSLSSLPLYDVMNNNVGY